MAKIQHSDKIAKPARAEPRSESGRTKILPNKYNLLTLSRYSPLYEAAGRKICA